MNSDRGWEEIATLIWACAMILVLVVSFMMMLPAPPEGSPAYSGRVDYWFERYQTITAGILGLLGGILAFVAIRKQTYTVQEQAEFDRRYRLREFNRRYIKKLEPFSIEMQMLNALIGVLAVREFVQSINDDVVNTTSKALSGKDVLKYKDELIDDLFFRLDCENHRNNLLADVRKISKKLDERDFDEEFFDMVGRSRDISEGIWKLVDYTLESLKKDMSIEEISDSAERFF
mgnify:CR=1 FL=1